MSMSIATALCLQATPPQTTRVTDTLLYCRQTIAPKRPIRGYQGSLAWAETGRYSLRTWSSFCLAVSPTMTS